MQFKFYFTLAPLSISWGGFSMEGALGNYYIDLLFQMNWPVRFPDHICLPAMLLGFDAIPFQTRFGSIFPRVPPSLSIF